MDPRADLVRAQHAHPRSGMAQPPHPDGDGRFRSGRRQVKVDGVLQRSPGGGRRHAEGFAEGEQGRHGNLSFTGALKPMDCHWTADNADRSWRARAESSASEPPSGADPSNGLPIPSAVAPAAI